MDDFLMICSTMSCLMPGTFQHRMKGVAVYDFCNLCVKVLKKCGAIAPKSFSFYSFTLVSSCLKKFAANCIVVTNFT